MKKHARHEFNKAIVGDRIRKIARNMLLNIQEIVVLEIGERTKMIAYDNRHNLTLGKLSFAISVSFTI